MSKKVLICDDEPHLVRLLQLNLERHGYTVLTAYDGKQGLELIQKERPNLIVLDIMMPILDGMEVLKQIRANPETNDLFVVVLTAKAQDQDVAEAYRNGADAFLTKPFRLQELLAVARMVRSRTVRDAASSSNWNPTETPTTTEQSQSYAQV